MGLNHVYKVIWNKTKGCYVVVSELAKRVGRNKAKAIVMATAAMAMVVTPAVMNVNQVEATVLIGSTNGTTISDSGSTVSEWGITIGGGITNAGSHTVHVGDATLEEGNRNVIIGTHATAGVDKIAGRHFVNQSVAIGSGANPNEGARAFGDQSIAIGANTIAEGNSSIAIGNDDVNKAVDKQITYTNPDGKEETNTLGKAYTNLTGKDLLTDGGQYADTRSGEAAVAIGVKAEAGDISLALGTGAKAKKVNTVSIGTGATADLDNSVAIGGGAVADKDSQGTKQTSTTINGITYAWAGGDKTNKGDIVSFGKPGFERQLKNIAAGEISSTSTDAINGSQIHSLVEKITGTPKLSYTTKDGTPVYKLGDKFYKVNEQGQPISAVGKPAVGTNEDGKLVDADKNVIEPIDPAVTPLKNALVNPNPAAGKTGTTSPTALNNITSNLVNFDAPNVNGKVPAKNALRNLVNDAVSDDTVATVGDLRNMGWIVSADKTTGTDGTATDTAYSETVKNANEVKFVGKDGAIVSGATDAATGVRTITVGLDKKAMSGSGDSGSPVAYTKADGTKVYPVKAENGSVTYHTTPNGDGPNDAEVPKTEVITSVNGPEGTTTPAALTNVAGNLVGAKKDTNAPTIEQVAPTVGKGANEVNPNNAATVGDVLNAGWNVQENGTAKDFVKPYDKVNFVNGGNTTAVVTTNAEGTVSNVSFNVAGLPVTYTTEDGKPVSKVGDKFYKVNEQGQPVSEAGKPAVKTNDAGKLVDEDGTEIEPINPATTPLKTAFVNPNPAADKTGTTSPTQLTNVEGNLIGAKTGTDTPTTEQAAPTLGTAANQVNVHNVATVGDVLNAGWNLQENGTAKDFVKPYDKVNFVNGGNTTAVVTTNAEGTVSNVSFNVAGLPVTYTTEDGKPVSKVGDKFYKVNEQGQPVSEAGKPAVKTNDAGKLVDEDGTEIEPINPATTPLKTALVNPNPAADKTGTTSPTQLTNVEGNLIGAKTGTDTPTTEQAAPTLGTAANQVNVHNVATVGDVLNAGWNLQENGTAKDFVKPYDKVNFVNGGNTTAVVTTNAEGTVSNVSFNVAGLPVTYTTEDGKPVSKVGDKFYKVNEQGQPVSEAGKPAVKTNDAGKLVDEDGTEIEPINPATTPLKNTLVNPNPAADKTGTTSPTALNNVTSGLNKYGDTVNNAPVPGSTPANNGLVDLSVPKDGQPTVSDNTAATVGDLRNMGWIVSSDKTTGGTTEYSATVKNAEEVKFVGTGMAIVSGKTDDKTGVRTITVDVDNQVGTNKSVTPVEYTKKDGKKVYPKEVQEGGKTVVKFYENPEGTGTEIPNTEVITSVNGPKGTTTPTTLSNVKGNLPTVNDADKTAHDVDGAPIADKNNTVAPITAKDAADLLAPMKDGAANPKFVGNNAATVSDVLNAGWNLQENGTAKDFVKPFDTVNFINGGNTTAVVTTNAEGTVSNVSFNVTGLPVTYTTEDGKPVSKVGDKFYKVNEQGQPISEAGKPAVKTNDAGKLVDEDGTEIEPINPATTPLKTAFVNPNPAADKTGTTSPTQLTNVEGNLVGAKTGTDTPTTEQAAPTVGKGANEVNPNNAATVGDVLNAGWNLQENGTAKDFVKPYDKVNFVNGGNTTAVVTTNAEGTVSNVSFNVTGLPVSYTTEDGKPVSKVGDKFYKVNEQGQPVSDAGKPAVKTNDAGKLVDEDGTEIEPINPATTPLKNALVNPNPAADKTGTTSPTALNNVTSGLHKYGDQVDGKPVEGTTPANTGLIDLSTPADGGAPKVSDNTAATVGDLRNMGWIVSADKTTGDLDKAYSATVKNANEVKFVGTGTAIVSGETKDGVRTITVNVDDQVSTNNATTPVVYTKADGTKVYPIKGENGAITYHTTPDGKGDNDQEVPGNQVVTSVNGPEGTTSPTTLKNVKNSLPTVNDVDKTAHNVDGTAIDGKNNTAAPITAKDAADLLAPMKDGAANPKFVGNNAATVSDVLNAGWNLQENGTAKDFVKPYDTVNFINGANTTVVVTTSEDGTTSKVTYNVTGLPVTYTTEDGKPVSKVGDKFYKVNEKGQPLAEDGTPAAGTDKDGNPITADGTVIKAIDPATEPLKTALVNPNPAADKTGTTSPTALNNVTSGLHKYGDQVDGKPVEGTTPANTGLIDLSTPADGGAPKVSDNTAATVGDLRNMGWIVSADKTTGDLDTAYSATVKNANEVKFVGTGTAIVSGETKDGVRTITVNVDDQVSTNNAVTPVVYTDKEGNTVYPIKDDKGNVTYHTTPDGKGENDKVVPNGDVNTSVNGPKDEKGNTRPASLGNVKNNIPAVNDADKKVTNADGTEKENPGDAGNINKAPLTAAEAANLLNPTTKDGKANPNFAGNNAATVSDVLNAGWNLQNNGTAKDFVKPFDTVNFVNGGNTTAVVTTKADGTTSDVTFNVTGLPIAMTITDPTTGKQVPVVKVGDTFYPANPDGTPNIARNDKGEPTNGYVRANDGKLYPREAVTVTPSADPTKPPTVTPNTDAKPTTVNTNLANPNVDNTTNEPGNNVNTPTQLGNVANGANTFAPVAADGTGATDAKPAVKLANDGKWYPADQVEANGKPKADATPVANPLATKNAAGDVLERGNDGNWYKASDLENGEPKPNVDEQTPVAKPANTEKAGLVNFENSNPNNAATVGDLQNLGFVVAAHDNGYTEQMRNANKVEFKGSNGVSVTGKTLKDGTREITVALKEGRVTNDVIVTNADGTETHGVRGEDGKIYVKDPKTGKATKTEIQVAPTDTVTNDGDAYVTGNSVATAIQKSGWNIGIGSTDKAFSEKAKTYERVNPKDNVKYVNGANTTVSMAVDAEKDRDGATVTTTYMKVDVNRDLNIDSVTTGGPAKDKDGNPLKLVDGKYYPENALVEDGKVYPAGTTFINGKPYPANTVMIDGKAYPAGSAKDPKTNAIVKDGQPATEVQPVTPLTATDVANVAPGKDGAMAVKDAKGNDGVSATAKDGKGTLTLNNAKAGKDGKDAASVAISTDKAPADLDNTPKDAVRANDGKWYAPADVDVKTENGTTVVTPKAGKSPIADAPTMDRIQYTGTDKKVRDVATMDDGLRFQGDDGESISKPLNSTVQLTGGNRADTGKPVAKDATTTGNIGVFNTDGKLSVQLAKDLDKLNSANFESKTDKAGNPLKAVDGKYYPENSVVQEGKVYPEGTVMIDNKPYPAGSVKDPNTNTVVKDGKPATEATPITPIDSTQVQDGPTSKLTGAGLTFNTPTPKDEKGNPLVLVDGKYYKADNLENGKPKADAKPEPVKPAQATAFTPDGLVVTPDTAKVVDPKTGEVKVDPNKVVSFGAPSIVTDPATGKPVIDPKTGEPVMKSGISAGGQVMSNVAPGVLDTDAVNVSQLKGVANNINMRMDRMGAQAAAMAGLRHLQYDPLEPTTIMAGVGTYKGEGALALGIAHYKNESTLFHAGASIGSRGDELMANAGVSWKFGSRADETAVKDTFRQGPISASYTLQDKVSALEAQNQMQKDEINTLKAQLAEVLQYIKKG